MIDDAEIDFDARRVAAQIYRHFAAGLLTNDQMEDSLPKSSERALYEIFFCGIWPLYDDLYEHKLAGRYHLTPKAREHVARLILFLHGSLPYRWPIVNTGWCGLVGGLAAIVTLGLYRPYRRRTLKSGGDESVWPFFSRAEYEEALSHPLFLRSSKCA